MTWIMAPTLKMTEEMMRVHLRPYLDANGQAKKQAKKAAGRG